MGSGSVGEHYCSVAPDSARTGLRDGENQFSESCTLAPRASLTRARTRKGLHGQQCECISAIAVLL